MRLYSALLAALVATCVGAPAGQDTPFGSGEPVLFTCKPAKVVWLNAGAVIEGAELESQYLGRRFELVAEPAGQQLHAPGKPPQENSAAVITDKFVHEFASSGKGTQGYRNVVLFIDRQTGAFYEDVNAFHSDHVIVGTCSQAPKP